MTAFSSVPAPASDLNRCGRYLVQGMLSGTPSAPLLLVYPGSDSEMRVRLRPEPPRAGLGFFVGKQVQVELRVDRGDQGAAVEAALFGVPLILPSAHAQRRQVTRVQALACARPR